MPLLDETERASFGVTRTEAGAAEPSLFVSFALFGRRRAARLRASLTAAARSRRALAAFH